MVVVTQVFAVMQTLFATRRTCVGATVAASAVAVTYLGTVSVLRRRNVLTSNDARKALHVGIGTLFCLCWRLFPSRRNARVYASAIPGTFTALTLATGLGMRLPSDSFLLHAMTRKHMRSELLHGPLIYGIAHVAASLCFWRASPHGIVGIACLCAGDGFADVVGRRVGHRKLPWNRDKSVAGTTAFVVMATAFGAALLTWHAHAIPLGRLAAISTATAIVETIPQLGEWDNAAVASTAMLLSKAFI